MFTDWNRKIKVGVIAGYMSLFDSIMPSGYREERRNWAEKLTTLLDSSFEFIFPKLIVNREDGKEVGEVLKREDVDVLLILPTMAAPPGYTWEAVKKVSNRPMIVWDAHEIESITPDYTMKDLVRHSSNVGSVMFMNLALRNGLNPQLVVSVYHETESIRQLNDKLKLGGLVGKLKKSSIGVIGEAIDGYDNVTAGDNEIRQYIGPDVKHISYEEFYNVFTKVTDSEVNEKIHLLKQMGNLQFENETDDELIRSTRILLTLESLTSSHQLIGGAFNCRSQFGLKNPEIGVIGCLGVSYLTTMGTPYTCTGDVVTALAMIITKQLGSDILYCECDQIDYNNDYMLMANTGESDFCFSCDKPCIIPTGENSGQKAKGASLFVRAKKGKGTLVGLSPKASAKGGWVLIIAPGEILGTEHEELKVGNAMFRFQNGPTAEAFRKWCMAGATHHGVLCQGNLVEDLSLIGEFLGIETIVI